MVKLSSRTSLFFFMVLLLDIVITIESKRDLDNALNLQHLLNYDNRRRTKFHQHYSFPDHYSRILRKKRSPHSANKFRDDLLNFNGSQITDYYENLDNSSQNSTPMEVSPNLNEETEKIDENPVEENSKTIKENTMMDYLFHSPVKVKKILPEAKKTLIDFKGPEMINKFPDKPHVRVKRNLVDSKKNNNFMQIIKALKKDLDKSRQEYAGVPTELIDKFDDNESDEDLDSETKKIKTSSNLKEEIGNVKCNLNDVYSDILNSPIEPMSPTIRLVRTKRTKCYKNSHNETMKSMPKEFVIIETSNPQKTELKSSSIDNEQSRRRRAFLFSKKKSPNKAKDNNKIKKNNKKVTKNKNQEQLPKELKLGDGSLLENLDNKKRHVHQADKVKNIVQLDRLKRNEKFDTKKENCDDEPLEAFIDPEFDKSADELYNSENNYLSQKTKRNNPVNSERNSDNDEQSEESKTNTNDDASQEKEILTMNEKMKLRIRRNQFKPIGNNYESKYDSNEGVIGDEGAEKSVQEVKNLVDKLLIKVNELKNYMGYDKIVARDKKAIESQVMDNSKAALFSNKAPPHENESTQSTRVANVTLPTRIIEEAMVTVNAKGLENRDLEVEGNSKNKEVDARDIILSSPLSKSNIVKASKVKRTLDRKWDKWTNWSSCSVTCGKGRQIRWRHCLKDCVDAESEMEQKTCQLPACPPNKFLGIF